MTFSVSFVHWFFSTNWKYNKRRRRMMTVTLTHFLRHPAWFAFLWYKSFDDEIPKEKKLRLTKEHFIRWFPFYRRDLKSRKAQVDGCVSKVNVDVVAEAIFLLFSIQLDSIPSFVAFSSRRIVVLWRFLWLIYLLTAHIIVSIIL